MLLWKRFDCGALAALEVKGRICKPKSGQYFIEIFIKIANGIPLILLVGPVLMLELLLLLKRFDCGALAGFEVKVRKPKSGQSFIGIFIKIANGIPLILLFGPVLILELLLLWKRFDCGALAPPLILLFGPVLIL